jgi:hypothetical protein
MTRILSSLLVLFLSINLTITAQIEDEFSDGNFTFNPNWIGTDTKFKINTSYQLTTSSNKADTAHLATPHLMTTLDEQEWHCWMKLSFSPSSNNFARYYLTASHENLSKNPTGFYLQFGEAGSGDAIRLFKQENGISKELCNGTIGAIASNFIAKIKVTRDQEGFWRIFSNYDGSENYFQEAMVMDSTNLLGKYTGIYCQYTISNATKFYFDNFYAGPRVVDKLVPEISSCELLNTNTLKIKFNEQIDSTALEVNTSILVKNSIFNVIQIKRDSLNTSLLVSLDPSLKNGITYNFLISGVKDLSGNKMLEQSCSSQLLISEIPQIGDLIFSEIMSSPSPVVGLPEIEYVEIYNVSDKYFQLENWKISDGTTSGKLVSGWILPKEYKVICAMSAVPFINGAIGATGFPALNNTGDALSLIDKTGKLIDFVHYNETWYMDEVKSKGGYSLERILLTHPCSDASNWSASKNTEGGTPGEINSVFSSIQIKKELKFNQLYTPNDSTLFIAFNQGMNLKSVQDAKTIFNPSVPFKNFEFEDDTLKYHFSEKINPSKAYSIKLSSIATCWLDTMEISGEFGLTEPLLKGDLLINELLVDPYSEGADFIELKNNSSKWIQLKGVSIANYLKGNIGTIKKITDSYILKPNDLVFISSSVKSQEIHYQSIDLTKGIQMDLPAYANDSGTVLIHSIGDELIDKVSYSKSWHFELLNTTEGKSLERITNEGNSSDAKNWCTAAQSIGFASPGLENSHRILKSSKNNPFSFTKSIISPNNDGNDDLLILNYELDEIESILNVTIFDIQGNLVLEWIKNEYAATQGVFVWDGINKYIEKTSIGPFVAYIEIVGIKTGNKSTFKLPFIVK